MENAAQSARPEARIIRLRTPETPIENPLSDDQYPALLSRFTLAYIDQLLDEHFK